MVVLVAGLALRYAQFSTNDISRAQVVELFGDFP